MREFVNFHLKTVLHIHKHLIILSLTSQKVDGQSLSIEPACPTHSMEVGISVGWEIIVDDKVHSLNVNSSSKKISSHKQA
jgi:hypothetical protein